MPNIMSGGRRTLPAASRPTINIRISFLPNMRSAGVPKGGERGKCQRGCRIKQLGICAKSAAPLLTPYAREVETHRLLIIRSKKRDVAFVEKAMVPVPRQKI